MTLNRSTVSDCLHIALAEGADQALADFPEMEPFRDELETLCEVNDQIDDIESDLTAARLLMIRAEEALFLAASGEGQ